MPCVHTQGLWAIGGLFEPLQFSQITPALLWYVTHILLYYFIDFVQARPGFKVILD